MKSNRSVMVIVALLVLPAVAQADWRDRHPRLAEREAAAERRHAEGLSPRFDHPDRPRRGRLTLEERRQLRRDILDAGSGLYRRPPPPPPPPPPPQN